MSITGIYNNYSEVDMSLNSGYGAVTMKNQLLHAPSTELLTAFRHANGIDIWVVTKVWGSNEWRMYLVDCNGVSNAPVSSFSGSSYYESDLTNNYGSVAFAKASPDGKKLAVTRIAADLVELFDFNNLSGTLTNSISFTQSWAFGLEFSADSKLMYVTTERENKHGVLYQYDMSVYNPISIKNSALRIAETPMYVLMSGLQMGPDGKIYCALPNQNFVAVVNSPGNRGLACDFVYNQMSLESGVVARCFPTFFPNLINNQNASFDFEASTDCRTVKFSGNTTITGNVIWKWDFGDGNSAQGQMVSHQYSNSDNKYKVQLTVVSANSCLAEAKMMREVNLMKETFATQFLINKTCGSTIVDFTGQTIGSPSQMVNWKWDFGDGQSSLTQNPTHTYADFGLYHVKINTTTGGGCSNGSFFDSVISVDAKPVANFSNDPVCTNKRVTFSDLSIVVNNTIVNWQWNFGNGNSSNEQHPAISFTEPGTYTASLTVNAENGCLSDVAEKQISVSPTPSMHFDIVDTCVGNVTYFEGKVRDNQMIDSWWWDFDNNENSITSSSEITFHNAGEHYVRLVGKSSNGCISDTFSRKVVIGPKPLADFEIEGSCENAVVDINNLSTVEVGIIVQFNWEFGNGDQLSAKNPNYRYKLPGTYSVRLETVSEKGCVSDVIEKQVVIESVPNIDFDFKGGCVGNPIVFENNSSNQFGEITKWEWDFGDQQASFENSPDHIYKGSGEFKIHLKASTTNNCSNTAVKTIGILKTVIDAGNDTSIIIGKPLQLHVFGGNSYKWEPSTYLNNPFSANPISFPEKDITYIVTGETLEGCIGYDTIHVSAFKRAEIFAPNAFAPNGKNNIFKPKFIGIKGLVEFVIYNRWGMVVFKTNEQGRGWDGTFKNASQPAGTYAWKLSALDYDNKSLIKSGTLILIR